MYNFVKLYGVNSGVGTLLSDDTSTITVDLTDNTLPISVASGPSYFKIEDEILKINSVTTDGTGNYIYTVDRAEDNTETDTHIPGSIVENNFNYAYYANLNNALDDLYNGSKELTTITLTTGLINIGDTTTTSSNINLYALDGNSNEISMYTGDSIRWMITSNATSETGSNAGSNFVINSYDDTGGYLSSIFTITRSSGAANLYGSLTVNGSSGNVNIPNTGEQIQFTHNGSNYLHCNGGSSASLNVYINGTNRTIEYASGQRTWYRSDGATVALLLDTTGSLTTYNRLYTEHILPKSANTYDMGTSGNRFNNIYCKGVDISGTLNIISGDDAKITFNSPTVDYNYIRSQVNNLNRWIYGVNNSSESGSNIGSDFFIAPYSDAGSSLGTSFMIERSTGTVITKHIVPMANNTYDLGDSTTIWNELFVTSILASTVSATTTFLIGTGNLIFPSGTGMAYTTGADGMIVDKLRIQDKFTMDSTTLTSSAISGTVLNVVNAKPITYINFSGGGASNVTTLSNGTLGQRITFIGLNSTNYPVFKDGVILRLSGDCNLLSYTVLNLLCIDATSSLWIETGRVTT